MTVMGRIFFIWAGDASSQRPLPVDTQIQRYSFLGFPSWLALLSTPNVPGSGSFNSLPASRDLPDATVSSSPTCLTPFPEAWHASVCFLRDETQQSCYLQPALALNSNIFHVSYPCFVLSSLPIALLTTTFLKHEEV